MLFRPVIIMKEGDRTTAWNAGYNGRHNFFLIRVFNRITAPIAVLGQELYEWRFNRIWGFLLGLPIAAVAFALTGGFIAPLIFMFLANLIGSKPFPGLQRRMELRGHMVETIIAHRLYGEDFEGYANLEAMSLVKYQQFKNKTLSECLTAMLAEKKVAEKWVNKHENWLRKRMKSNDSNS